MSIGELRDRLTIQQYTEGKDDYGGVTKTWATLATVWGRNLPKVGREVDDESRRVSVTEYIFKIRYRSDVTTLMRISWNSRTFDIKGIINPDGIRKYMHLICEERL